MEVIQSLGLALAIGLLVGIERGWRERESKPGSRVAGIRTYALIGLLGGFSGLLAESAGTIYLGFAGLSFAAGFALFEWRKGKAALSFSATGYIAGLLVFAMGAYAVLGDKTAAVAAAVAVTLVLAERNFLHAALRRLEWIDLRRALLLLVMTFILLPILPDRTVDPWDALNPHQLWIATILIAATSYCGYIAIKIAGSANGLLFAGLAGGLVSSTMVTWSFSQLARQHAASRLDFMAGILSSWAVSLSRMSAIAIVIAPEIFPTLAPLTGPAIFVIVVAAAFCYSQAKKTEPTKLEIRDPFDFYKIVQFALLLAAIMLATKWLLDAFGTAGVFSLAAISGLADVDAITLSMANSAGGALTYTQAAFVIIAAAAANMLAKCALAVVFGGWRFGLPLTGIALLAVCIVAPIILLVAS